MKNLKLIFIVVIVALFMSTGRVVASGLLQINKKVDQLKIGSSSLEEVVRKHSYQYTGRGGLSWGIPYATGVLALGWQIDPDLSATRAKEMLFESAYSTTDGGKIIDPGKFVELVKTSRPGNKGRHHE